MTASNLTAGNPHHGHCQYHRRRRRRRQDVKEYTFVWEGVDRNNRQVRGETKAASETVVTTNLRRQGIRIQQDQAADVPRRQGVNEKDITFFTRQLATMLKAGRAAAAVVRDRRARPQPTRASRGS